EDVVAVRDEILKAFAAARSQPVDARRLADARANARYALVRSLDTTEAVAETLANFARFRRAYDTLNRYYQLYEGLTPADLQAAARKYFTDAGLVFTTLSHGPLPEAVKTLPALARFEPAGAGPAPIKAVTAPTALPLVTVKLLFRAGSAHDPKGKEGLAALAASMLAEAGSREKRIDEIKRGLFPIAGQVDAQVDKELTTFTLGVHRDNWPEFSALALPMLLEPGFREDDFRRLKDAQRNALEQDLRANNEEELGKERLQANVFAGTPYGHPVLGSLAGIDAITLDDVKDFVRRAYTRAGLTLGLAGDLPAGLAEGLQRRLGALPEGPALPEPAGVTARAPKGLEVEILQKETRATAISFGHPIGVTRGHPDFPALYLARTWLGEHRSSISHLYQRIREVRGMNYGDYAYIEAFPGGMFRLFPEANVARRAQLFEVWIRPVVPAHAHMALRIALHELQKMIDEGLSAEDFEATRNYLMKSVFLLTASQGQQLGYALDSDWYRTPEFTAYMRQALAKLTRDDVNRAVRRHLSAKDLSVVIITKEAQALRDALVADAPSTVTYDAEKPPELLAEDKVIGARKLGIRAEAVHITPVEQVFAR
ncbi:MAG TPA: insulinase family protein, partial [Vicinamibacteria bacterium]